VALAARRCNSTLVITTVGSPRDPHFAIKAGRVLDVVEPVMTPPPYNDARRVFWIVDNCSAPLIRKNFVAKRKK
jgi:hypothetical protein